jgi:hypothetical protein
MYARVARFQTDPAEIDTMIDRVRSETAGDPPPGLEGAKLLMLVNRETGQALGITLFESEEALRRGDAALNARPGGSGRTAVEVYEVPLQRM